MACFSQFVVEDVLECVPEGDRERVMWLCRMLISRGYVTARYQGKKIAAKLEQTIKNMEER